MADTVTEVHQLLHPFLAARQCPAGARRSASSVARAFVGGSQPQPRRLPVTSHPSWLCPAARACGLPAADRAGPPRAWGASGTPWPGMRQAWPRGAAVPPRCAQQGAGASRPRWLPGA